MKEFTVGKNDANQRLDRWLSKNLPLLPAPLAQKYIRLKRVKLNGKGAKRDTRLQVGDLLQLYINDEFFEIPTPENAFLKLFKPKLDIVYEDETYPAGQQSPRHGGTSRDETERVNTLINHIQAYLYQKRRVEPLSGARLRPRAVQPHRPEHRRHRHRRQDRRGTAGDEPEDSGSGAGQVVPVRHCGADPSRRMAR